MGRSVLANFYSTWIIGDIIKAIQKLRWTVAGLEAYATRRTGDLTGCIFLVPASQILGSTYMTSYFSNYPGSAAAGTRAPATASFAINGATATGPEMQFEQGGVESVLQRARLRAFAFRIEFKTHAPRCAALGISGGGGSIFDD